MLTSSSFSFKQLRAHPITIHIVIPVEEMNVYQPFLRAMGEACVRELHDAAQEGISPSVRLLPDEFPQLRPTNYSSGNISKEDGQSC